MTAAQLSKQKYSLSNLRNMVTSIVRRNFPFVAGVKSVMNFSAAFEKKYGVSFLAAWMADIVDDMVSSDIVSGNSAQRY